MKQGLTEIVSILDRSGSMSGLVNDVIGGYNSFIADQKKEPGEASVTLVIFDTVYDVVYSGKPINEVPELTSKVYNARGMTALLDAIGRTIIEVGDRLAKTPEDERPEKVLFMIQTDGAENSSTEFSQSKVKEMIEHQQTVYGWAFTFLGANIDSAQVGSSFGIPKSNTLNWQPSSIGVSQVYASMNANTRCYRSTGLIDLKDQSEQENC